MGGDSLTESEDWKTDPKVTVNGPKSLCPECLMDFMMTYKKCSGCGNDYEGWSFIIRRDKVLQKMIPTEYFICPACQGEVQDITFDFNSVEDWIVFECPECGQDLQIEPPKPTEGKMLQKLKTIYDKMEEEE